MSEQTPKYRFRFMAQEVMRLLGNSDLKTKLQELSKPDKYPELPQFLHTALIELIEIGTIKRVFEKIVAAAFPEGLPENGLAPKESVWFLIQQFQPRTDYLTWCDENQVNEIPHPHSLFTLDFLIKQLQDQWNIMHGYIFEYGDSWLDETRWERILLCIKRIPLICEQVLKHQEAVIVGIFKIFETTSETTYNEADLPDWVEEALKLSELIRFINLP